MPLRKKLFGLISIGFVVITLVTLLSVTNNPLQKFYINSLARYNPDALIRQRERAGQRGNGPVCEGAGCLAPEIIANRDNPNNQVGVAAEIIKTYDEATSGNPVKLTELKELNEGVAAQVEEQLAQQTVEVPETVTTTKETTPIDQTLEPDETQYIQEVINDNKKLQVGAVTNTTKVITDSPPTTSQDSQYANSFISGNKVNTNIKTNNEQDNYWYTLLHGDPTIKITDLGTTGLGGGNATVLPPPTTVVDTIKNPGGIYKYALDNTISFGAGFSTATAVTPGAPAFVFETVTSIPGVIRILTLSDVVDSAITGTGCAMGNQDACAAFQASLFIPAPTGVGNMLSDSLNDLGRAWNPSKVVSDLSSWPSLNRLPSDPTDYGFTVTLPAVQPQTTTEMLFAPREQKFITQILSIDSPGFHPDQVDKIPKWDQSTAVTNQVDLPDDMMRVLLPGYKKPNIGSLTPGERMRNILHNSNTSPLVETADQIQIAIADLPVAQVEMPASATLRKPFTAVADAWDNLRARFMANPPVNPEVDVNLPKAEIETSRQPIHDILPKTDNSIKDRWTRTTENVNDLKYQYNIQELELKLRLIDNFEFNPNGMKILGKTEIDSRLVLEIELPNKETILMYRSTGTNSPSLKQKGDWIPINGFAKDGWFIKIENNVQIAKGGSNYITGLADYLKNNESQIFDNSIGGWWDKNIASPVQNWIARPVNRMVDNFVAILPARSGAQVENLNVGSINTPVEPTRIDINYLPSGTRPEVQDAIKYANDHGINVYSLPPDKIGLTNPNIEGSASKTGGIARYPDEQSVTISERLFHPQHTDAARIIYHEVAGHMIGQQLPRITLADRIINEILAQRTASLMLTQQGLSAYPNGFANIDGLINRYRELTGRDPYPIIDLLIGAPKIERVELLTGIPLKNISPSQSSALVKLRDQIKIVGVETWSGVTKTWDDSLAKTKGLFEPKIARIPDLPARKVRPLTLFAGATGITIGYILDNWDEIKGTTQAYYNNIVNFTLLNETQEKIPGIVKSLVRNIPLPAPIPQPDAQNSIEMTRNSPSSSPLTNNSTTYSLNFGDEFRPIDPTNKLNMQIVPTEIIIHWDGQPGAPNGWNTNLTFNGLSEGYYDEYTGLWHSADSHFGVDKNGIVQYLNMQGNTVQFSYGAKGYPNAINIEMAGNQFQVYADGTTNVPRGEIDNTVKLIIKLMEQYNIPIDKVFGHSERDITKEIKYVLDSNGQPIDIVVTESANPTDRSKADPGTDFMNYIRSEVEKKLFVTTSTTTTQNINVQNNTNVQNLIPNSQVTNGLYAQTDPDLATLTIPGGQGKPFKNIGCGQTTVANILCKYSSTCLSPIEIAKMIPIEEYGTTGLTSTQSNIKILNDYGFTTDPYIKSLQYHLTEYMEPTDVLWISGKVGNIDHHTYLDGYTIDSTGTPVYNLNDSYFGDGYKCKTSGDSTFSCFNDEGNHIGIGVENANLYIIDTNQ